MLTREQDIVGEIFGEHYALVELDPNMVTTVPSTETQVQHRNTVHMRCYTHVEDMFAVLTADIAEDGSLFNMTISDYSASNERALAHYRKDEIGKHALL